MSNTIKLVGATGAVLAGYKSLEYGINKAVEQYLPEPVAKNFPTPLVAGGAVLAAVGATVSHPAIAGTVLFVNSSVESVRDQIMILRSTVSGLVNQGITLQYIINNIGDIGKNTVSILHNELVGIAVELNSLVENLD